MRCLTKEVTPEDARLRRHQRLRISNDRQKRTLPDSPEIHTVHRDERASVCLTFRTKKLNKLHNRRSRKSVACRAVAGTYLPHLTSVTANVDGNCNMRLPGNIRSERRSYRHIPVPVQLLVMETSLTDISSTYIDAKRIFVWDLHNCLIPESLYAIYRRVDYPYKGDCSQNVLARKTGNFPGSKKETAGP